VMTRNVVAVTKDTPLEQVVELMETRRIKRLPVVEGGKLVGIVSRLDLVRALYVQSLTEPAAPATDPDIEARLTAEIAGQGWRLSPSSKIAAFEGVVHLWGDIASMQEKHALVAAAKAIPGVRAVQDHLEIQEQRIEFI
jgi:CBS domain-containing protein